MNYEFIINTSQLSFKSSKFNVSFDLVMLKDSHQDWDSNNQMKQT